jgi:LacI family transcriptional regulator
MGIVRTQRQVAVVMETSRGYARGLARGIARYNREHDQWALYFTPRGMDDPMPSWLKGWKGDGILARLNSRSMAQRFLASGIPIIDLRCALSDLELPSIGPDDDAVARLVMEHLLGRGFRHLGFYGTAPGTHMAMDAREREFRRLAEQEGLSCSVLRASIGRGGGPFSAARQKRLAAWLSRLPRPAGVMTCNDDHGLELLDVCRRCSIRVPDEIAVVGVGNDECLCELSLPPLSSVDLHPERVGYEAAAMLDLLMAGRAVKPRQQVLEPMGIVTRLSSDVLATEDRQVALAVSFIRQHACQRIQVQDVLRHVRMSRAGLEPRLKRVLGRTVHQEIQRVRIERVKQLLCSTDAPLKQISLRAGFQYPEYMMRVFQRLTGTTPTQYRRSMRGR